MIEDIKDLNLPDIYTGNLSDTIYQHRMLWEVWLEGADNFYDLRNKLHRRGYSNIPNGCSPLHQIKPNRVAKTLIEGQPIIPKIRNFNPKPVMVQRRVMN